MSCERKLAPKLMNTGSRPEHVGGNMIQLLEEFFLFVF
jgi:hypothetical protein